MTKTHPVRKLRLAAGLTQAAFAKRLKIQQAYLSQIETGVKRNLSVPLMRRIIKASGHTITFNQLVNPNERG